MYLEIKGGERCLLCVFCSFSVGRYHMMLLYEKNVIFRTVPTIYCTHQVPTGTSDIHNSTLWFQIAIICCINIIVKANQFRFPTSNFSFLVSIMGLPNDDDFCVSIGCLYIDNGLFPLFVYIFPKSLFCLHYQRFQCCCPIVFDKWWGFYALLQAVGTV